jgi:hypothetical protein
MPYKFSVPRPFKDSEEEYLEFPDDVPISPVNFEKVVIPEELILANASDAEEKTSPVTFEI